MFMDTRNICRAWVSEPLQGLEGIGDKVVLIGAHGDNQAQHQSSADLTTLSYS